MSNLELAHEKLFSTAEGAEKINEEIHQAYNQFMERGARILNRIPESEDTLSNEELQKLGELGEFLREYLKDWGEEVVVYHIQTGLNILTGNRKESIIPELVRLEETCYFDEPTLQKLRYVMARYSLGVIEDAIISGGQNNHIWATKNNENIETGEVVKEITNKLDKRRKS